MSEHELVGVVRRADDAINRRDLAAVMEFYDDDATLVIEPGRLARGKAEIARAHQAIFAFFNQSLKVAQRDFHVVEAGAVALVVCKLSLSAQKETARPVTMERTPTYVFRRSPAGAWLCVIDNSYGVDLAR